MEHLQPFSVERPCQCDEIAGLGEPDVETRFRGGSAWRLGGQPVKINDLPGVISGIRLKDMAPVNLEV